MFRYPPWMTYIDIASADRQQAGDGALGRKWRIGGVAAYIHHRQAAGGRVAAGVRADVELVVVRQRHRGVEAVANRDGVGGQAGHVADVHRVIGGSRSRRHRASGNIERRAVQQAYAGAANWHRRLDCLRRDVQFCHRSRPAGSAFRTAIQHIGGIAVGC